MSIRERIRVRIAKHENLFAFMWYLHLVKNEPPQERGIFPSVRTLYLGTRRVRETGQVDRRK